jgi:glycosyltransferase involved in cell wall biosynthesis
MGLKGYEAKTFVYEVFNIHKPEDYDYYLFHFFRLSFLPPRIKRVVITFLGPYMTFLWVLPRFDIFHFFYDGGFLGKTPLGFFEIQLLHLAGKKVVVMPYGSDVAVPTHIHSLIFRQGIMRQYKYLGIQEKKTMKWIRYFTCYADFIVACLFHLETLPAWDLLTTHYYPIDTEAWFPIGNDSSHNGKDGPVTIAHASNHREVKGTDFLIAACQDLQAEGFQVSLRLLEGISNEEVKCRISDSDILAEQFIHGYGLTAMEGMSLGKPVMSNLSDDHYYQLHRVYTGLGECPIVNTPIDRVKDNLKMLVTNPALRKKLGEAGRQYVLQYHSYEAVAKMWDLIYRKIWLGERINFNAWHPDRFSEKINGFT